MKNWQEVKKEIHKETERIWLSEPDEIKKLRLGILDTGAAAFGQYLGALVFLHGYLMNTGAFLRLAVLDAAEDQGPTLQQMKYLARKVLSRTRGIGFCGLKRVHELANVVLESLDSVEDKSDYFDLISAFSNYIWRMFFWVHNIFPWWLGMSLQTKTKKGITEILDLMK